MLLIGGCIHHRQGHQEMAHYLSTISILTRYVPAFWMFTKTPPPNTSPPALGVVGTGMGVGAVGGPYLATTAWTSESWGVERLVKSGSMTAPVPIGTCTRPIPWPVSWSITRKRRSSVHPSRGFNCSDSWEAWLTIPHGR